MLRGLVAVLLATQSAATGVARAPHLVYVLLDDFGWAEAGFQNASAEVRKRTVYSPDRGAVDAGACEQAMGPNGGY